MNGPCALCHTNETGYVCTGGCDENERASPDREPACERASPDKGSAPPLAARCPNCDDTGDVHSIDGEWRGACSCLVGFALANSGTRGSPTMTAEDRRAFEVFARGTDNRYDMESYGEGVGFGYVNQDVDFMWEGWQYALTYAREWNAPPLATPAAPTAEPAEDVLWELLNEVTERLNRIAAPGVYLTEAYSAGSKFITKRRATPPAAGLVAEPPEQP